MGSALIGRTLGDFEIESSVGRGSFAEVFIARQLSLRRRIALKVLEVGLFTPSDNVTRFLREAEAMARMEHPHIVPVYAAGQEHPYHFFAMRLIGGGGLVKAMQTGVQRRTALRWMCEVCEALAYAHERNVVHRDVKPSNILLQDDAAVLVDFGLARLKDLSTLTQSGMVLGTPMYMSPEQTLGKEAGPASDVFSLGVLMYELLFGQHPFSAQIPRNLTRIEARARLFELIRKSEFALPSAVDPSLPPVVEQILMKALHPDPDVRFSDGAAMLPLMQEALRAFPQDERTIKVDASDLSTPENSGSTEAVASGSSSSSGKNARALSPQTSPQQFGRYQIQSEVGHGGQGVVYRAYDPVVDRDIALKVLQTSPENAEMMRAFLEHEARVTGRLAHPHIIQVYDYGVEGVQPYLTMQFVDGPSLDGLLAARKPMPLAFVLHVIQQTAEALSYAHKSGVIHLDVKPGNILVGQPARTIDPRKTSSFGSLAMPHVYLSDFTMAAIRRDIKQTVRLPSPVGSAHVRPGAMKGMTAGTIPYAAPEQLESGEANHIGTASDIFALGVVFHEMLTGQRLFAADNLSVTQVLVLRGHVMPPSHRVPHLPPEVDDLCLRMLAKDVKDRLSSAETIVHATMAMLEKMGQ